MSVNLELPSQPSLSLLAPEKSKENILTPMKRIRDWHIEYNPPTNRRPLLTTSNSGAIILPQQKAISSSKNFIPGGQSTQLIIGASPEDDRQVLALSESLYKKMKLKRVYYSAYIPVNQDQRLPATNEIPLLREHRLYQADWLLRFYRFSVDELFENGPPNLDNDFDPKVMWALRHPELFPVDVNRADLETLLRVPGLGLISARRIIQTRRVSPLNYEDLHKLGLVMKRARFFLSAPGYEKGVLGLDPAVLRQRLLRVEPQVIKPKQLSFNAFPGFQPDVFRDAVMGQF
jgi:predicted DNA-binding helix-hairpin-helix protein